VRVGDAQKPAMQGSTSGTISRRRKSESEIIAFSRVCHAPAPLEESIFRKIVASIQDNWLIRVAVVAADANRLNLHLYGRAETAGSKASPLSRTGSLSTSGL
jgi:hypothetical protein